MPHLFLFDSGIDSRTNRINVVMAMPKPELFSGDLEFVARNASAAVIEKRYSVRQLEVRMNVFSNLVLKSGFFNLQRPVWTHEYRKRQPRSSRTPCGEWASLLEKSTEVILQPDPMWILAHLRAYSPIARLIVLTLGRQLTV